MQRHTPGGDCEDSADSFAHPLPQPLVAGKYRILGEIGRGGMGVVYRAEDTRLKRPVALKFLSEAMSGEPGARSRFLREAQAAAALDNPHVCVAR